MGQRCVAALQCCLSISCCCAIDLCVLYIHTKHEPIIYIIYRLYINIYTHNFRILHITIKYIYIYKPSVPFLYLTCDTYITDEIGPMFAYHVGLLASLGALGTFHHISVRVSEYQVVTTKTWSFSGDHLVLVIICMARNVTSRVNINQQVVGGLATYGSLHDLSSLRKVVLSLLKPTTTLGFGFEASSRMAHGPFKNRSATQPRH